MTDKQKEIMIDIIKEKTEGKNNLAKVFLLLNGSGIIAILAFIQNIKNINMYIIIGTMLLIAGCYFLIVLYISNLREEMNKFKEIMELDNNNICKKEIIINEIAKFNETEKKLILALYGIFPVAVSLIFTGIINML